jgi:hypothetical protein
VFYCICIFYFLCNAFHVSVWNSPVLPSFLVCLWLFIWFLLFLLSFPYIVTLQTCPLSVPYMCSVLPVFIITVSQFIFMPCNIKTRIKLLLLQVQAEDLYLNGERQEKTLPHVFCWQELVSRMCAVWVPYLDICSWLCTIAEVRCEMHQCVPFSHYRFL